MNRIAAIAASIFMGALLAAQASAADFGADRHIARGLKCESCHGPNMDPKNPTYPDQEACLKCHNREDIASKTKQLNPNPHTAPHNNDCTLCHLQHEPEENYCAQCHQFDWKMKAR